MKLSEYYAQIDHLKQEIEPFEKKYKMTSEDFYREFESGKLGDDGDFFEWGGLCEKLPLYESRVKKIEALNT